MSETFAIERDGLRVGDRWFPAEKVAVEDIDAGNLWRSRRALLRFENGWCVSVVFGTGTYSDNHDDGYSGREFREEPVAVEVWGWWGADGAHWPIEGGDVLGYQSVKEVLDLIALAQTWPSP